MNSKRLIRDLHHWGSIVVAIPIAIMIGAGLLLMLKKQIDWLQPPTQRGAGLEIAADGTFTAQPLDVLYQVARDAKPGAFAAWDDVARIDIKPGRDIVKFVSTDNWEVQIDLATAEVLQVAYRRSDLIESIHDGSFFSGWTKLFFFFPAGIVLLGLWATGLYLFALPHYKMYRKRRNNASP